MGLSLQTIRLSNNEVGLLRKQGLREVVITVKLLDGADDIDSGELVSAIKRAYSAYYETTQGRLKEDKGNERDKVGN